MLISALVSYDEQTIAERVREHAALTTADHALTEQAVDEAIRTFRAQDAKRKDVHGAVFSGLLFLNDMLLYAARVEAMQAAFLVPVPKLAQVAKERIPFAWVETWPAYAAAAVIATALLLARAFGVLS